MAEAFGAVDLDAAADDVRLPGHGAIGPEPCATFWVERVPGVILSRKK